MKHTFTHKGIMIIPDEPLLSMEIMFRETKLFWVSQKGVKFRKTNGCIPNCGQILKGVSLDIESVKPLEAQEPLTCLSRP